ncbi:MAG: thiamine pyrophosphate-binding protein [Gemmataceae bacterium]
MSEPLSRRDVLKVAGAAGLAALAPPAAPAAIHHGWVVGEMTGARALVQTLIAEGTMCVFGIPGAQENEVWDEMKSQHLPYLLCTHEFSASCMADGAARATGRPGVVCIVPGPGITNALTGIGEALLDGVPMVVVAGDVGRGCKYKRFQVHELPNAALLKPVSKVVIEVTSVGQIALAVRQAFQAAVSGEPGPASVVIPYNLLIEAHKFHSAPLAPLPTPFDETAFVKALDLLRDHKLRVGIYAGMGCMDYSGPLTRVAEMLQAPVATSVSGKGVINDCHPLAVGWGYGKQGSHTAEEAFKRVDLVLAVGVRFSEVSTGFYCLPHHPFLIHVDACAENLGQVMKPTTACVQADAGVFLTRLLAHEAEVARPANQGLITCIHKWKLEDAAEHAKVYATCGVDPMAFLLALRRATCANALVFVDVSMTEHWAAEAFTVFQPRTYFNPTDNQSMGWSIPAAIGAQRVAYDRQVVTLTGDGCFLMSALELSTAAREGLPVKLFVLDDQAYHYMQVLQKQAYKRTTATFLARLDYAALAKGLGVGHAEITAADDLEAKIQAVLAAPGPVLASVVTDYGKRPCRWIKAVKGRFTEELSTSQKLRFLGRLGTRSLAVRSKDD